MASIIDGKAIAAEIRKEIAEEATALAARGTTPGLAVVLVGDDPASRPALKQEFFPMNISCLQRPVRRNC